MSGTSERDWFDLVERLSHSMSLAIDVTLCVFTRMGSLKQSSRVSLWEQFTAARIVTPGRARL
jgi:hypothetical protein